MRVSIVSALKAAHGPVVKVWHDADHPHGLDGIP